MFYFNGMQSLREGLNEFEFEFFLHRLNLFFKQTSFFERMNGGSELRQKQLA